MGRFCFGFVKKGLKVTCLCEYNTKAQNKETENKANPTCII